jgi:hypothetical protein
MRHHKKTTTLFAFALLGLLLTTSGCDHISEAIDCDQLCSKMQSCLDSDIDVDECSHSCEQRVHDDELADELDRCTDCMDHGYSCSEIVDECSACDEVQMELIDY